jgi:hypothetical protein
MLVTAKTCSEVVERKVRVSECCLATGHEAVSSLLFQAMSRPPLLSSEGRSWKESRKGGENLDGCCD